MRGPPTFVAGALLVACAILLAGCGRAPAPPSAQATQEPAELHVGDVTVRATALPTERLGEAMAREYGVARAPGTVLLVVGLRRGPVARETALTGAVTAKATDLLGKRQAVVLREVRSGGFVDYVGTFEVAPPDTLRFDVEARIDGRISTLQFNRDFFPR